MTGNLVLSGTVFFYSYDPDFMPEEERGRTHVGHMESFQRQALLQSFAARANALKVLDDIKTNVNNPLLSSAENSPSPSARLKRSGSVGDALAGSPSKALRSGSASGTKRAKSFSGRLPSTPTKTDTTTTPPSETEVSSPPRERPKSAGPRTPEPKAAQQEYGSPAVPEVKEEKEKPHVVPRPKSASSATRSSRSESLAPTYSSFSLLNNSTRGTWGTPPPKVEHRSPSPSQRQRPSSAMARLQSRSPSLTSPNRSRSMSRRGTAHINGGDSLLLMSSVNVRLPAHTEALVAKAASPEHQKTRRQQPQIRSSSSSPFASKPSSPKALFRHAGSDDSGSSPSLRSPPAHHPERGFEPAQKNVVVKTIEFGHIISPLQWGIPAVVARGPQPNRR